MFSIFMCVLFFQCFLQKGINLLMYSLVMVFLIVASFIYSFIYFVFYFISLFRCSFYYYPFLSLLRYVFLTHFFFSNEFHKIYLSMCLLFYHCICIILFYLHCFRSAVLLKCQRECVERNISRLDFTQLFV